MVNRFGPRLKHTEYNLQRQDQRSTVTDLVYKYLRKVSHSNSIRKQRNNACYKFRKSNKRKRSIHTRKYITAEYNDARNYIRDALSFAVSSGYLIPTDRTGRILRLSPSLELHRRLI
ncbi:uncharacterized protein LOC143358032 [Halictus rubicundus]|uniref:uncharacterized protein LOC143358032 n=1 Tax=Halictus rubicundus TaxID=77578 RepID=UPI0040372D70